MQVSGSDIGDAQDELGDGGSSLRVCLQPSLLPPGRHGGGLVDVVADEIIEAVSIVSMVRVRRVEERKLGVLTLVFANLVLKLSRVRRTSNESGSTIDDSYYTESCKTSNV